ncbi:MAG TPA: hypothetical protein VNH21_12375 [Steroidobacteraceae bacterium]|nr:hypothetical protein [Steroidobacteraceae bacterium]
MSGYANISAFPDNKLLFEAASGQATADVQNALYRGQEHQQAIGSADTEMAARIASTLVATNDEAEAAQLYPGMISEAKARGFLKNAPDVWPGMARARVVAAMGTSSADQYKRQGAAAGLDAVYPDQTAPAPGASAAPTSGGGGGAGGGGVALGMRQNNPGNLMFAGQPNASPGQGNRFATFPDMQSGVAATADQLAINQTQHGVNTVRGQVTRWVSDPKADLTTYIADTAKALGVSPDAPIDWTDPKVQAAFILAQQPHESGGGGAVLNPADVQKGVLMAAANRGRSVQAPPAQRVAAAPPPSVGVAARTGGVDVAGPPAAPPVAAAPPPAAPSEADPETGLPVQTAAAAPPDAAPAVPAPPVQLAPPPAPAASAPAPAPPPAAVAAPPADGGAPVTSGFQPSRSDAQQPQAPAIVSMGLTAEDHVAVRNMKRALAATSDPSAGAKLQAEIDKRQMANRKMAIDAWTAANPNIRATPVPGVDEQGRVGSVMVQGSRVVGFVPSPVRPANAPWELQKADYERDAKDLPELNSSVQLAQANQIRIQKMRALIEQVSTGAGGNWRAAWANVAQTAGYTDLAKRLIGGTSSDVADPTAAAQEIAKLGLMSAGTQERGDLGARGSIGAINLYKAANPGLDLRPDANKAILAMQLVSEQAKIDYATQATAFANAAGDSFERGGNYTKLSHFDSQWAAQRNPQIYAAAMSALAGDPYEKWTAALNMGSAGDRAHVIEVLKRADPTAVIKWKDGQGMTVGQPPG